MGEELLQVRLCLYTLVNINCVNFNKLIMMKIEIVKWVNGKIGTNRKVKVAPSHVMTLNSENFGVALGEKAALVEFYAPWYKF